MQIARRNLGPVTDTEHRRLDHAERMTGKYTDRQKIERRLEDLLKALEKALKK